MPQPVVLLALDAAEPTALATGPDDHRFPTLAGLSRDGAAGRLVGHERTIPGAAWPEIHSGRDARHTGVYLQFNQMAAGESRVRALRPDELGSDRFFWNLAADAGQRVAAVDVPFAPARGSGPLTEVAGWGTHYRKWAPHASPGPAAEIVRDLTPHPVGDCAFDVLRHGNGLLDMLAEGIDGKTTLLQQLLGSASWDLFVGAFSESHCVGHHFWPQEPGDQRVDRIYRHLDRALGQVLAAVGPDTTVIVLTSHGMRRADNGCFLVFDVLERMGLVRSNRRRRQLSALVPDRMRPLLRRLAGPTALQRAGVTVDRSTDAGRAIALPSGDHGLIRLSLAGRDPGGVIEPGSSEHEQIVAAIRNEFTTLRTGDGQPVVAEVLSSDGVFGRDRHPALPDLVIRFRDDLGLLTEAHSASLGTIRAARQGREVGQHGTPGAIWVRGPQVPSGSSLGDIRTTDVAPTVLTLLGIDVPEWMDGQPIPGIH